MTKQAIYVLRAISLYLDLEEDHFDKYVKKGNSILRPIHYPPIKTKPKGAERAAAHGDINLITLLMGAHGRKYLHFLVIQKGHIPLMNLFF